MNENKLIITKSKYGYELRTPDHRFYVIDKRNGKFNPYPLKIKNKDQMTGTEINYIPNEIKKIVFDLNKKPE